MSDKQRIAHFLPDTFFADRNLAFRVQQLVNSWQRAIEANQRLEGQIAQLLTDKEASNVR